MGDSVETKRYMLWISTFILINSQHSALDVHYKEYASLKSLHNCYYVITIKLIMRRWKGKSKRKILYLLDNRKYTKMRNDNTTSPSRG